MPRYKDTDYLYMTGVVRAREPNLVNRERIERMLESGSAENAAKVLEECGWGDLASAGVARLEETLSAKRAKILAELSLAAPNPYIIDVFRLKYDYHNAKVLIKASAASTEGGDILLEGGRVAGKDMEEAFLQGDFRLLPSQLASAIEEAKEVMGRTMDPQLADFVLDREYFSEFLLFAEQSGCDFLLGYARLSIDAANLRSAVRAFRMKKDASFLQQVLIPGGEASTASVLAAFASEDGLLGVFSSSPLKTAAEAGAEAMRGGRLTVFEKLCDNALSAYLSGARYNGFGAEPVIAYIYAIDMEIGALRTILTGLASGIAPETIRERLRDMPL